MKAVHPGLENENLVTIVPPEGWHPNPDGYAHGGDQAWLPTRLKRSTGCGGVAAVNILAYFLLCRGGDPKRAVRAADWLGLFDTNLQ